MPMELPHEHPAECGVLGHYAIEGTQCFGLFIRLDNYKAFVDIKKDKFFEQRKTKALDLYENQQLLSGSLVAFLESSPDFRSRRVAYIGLHSKNLGQGEVFWDPTGYTLLKGLKFQPE